MEEKLDLIVNKVDSLSNKVDTLTVKVDDLTVRVSDIEEDNKETKQKLNALEKDNKGIKDTLKKLDTSVEQLKHNQNFMFDMLQEVRERGKRMEDKLDNLTKVVDVNGARLTIQGDKIDIGIRDKIDGLGNKIDDYRQINEREHSIITQAMQELYQESKNDRKELHIQVDELRKTIIA